MQHSASHEEDNKAGLEKKRPHCVEANTNVVQYAHSKKARESVEKARQQQRST